MCVGETRVRKRCEDARAYVLFCFHTRIPLIMRPALDPTPRRPCRRHAAAAPPPCRTLVVQTACRAGACKGKGWRESRGGGGFFFFSLVDTTDNDNACRGLLRRVVLGSPVPSPTEDLGSGILDRGTKARGTCVSWTCARCRSSDPDLGRTQTRSACNGRASLSSFLPPTPAVRDELIGGLGLFFWGGGGGGLSVPLLNSDRTHREHV